MVGCVGPAVGAVCGGTNSSGKSVTLSATIKGPLPVTATLGRTETTKIRLKDVRDAIFKWARPGLDIITGTAVRP
jgi:hypothetical protein